jgi:putative transposase
LCDFGELADFQRAQRQWIEEALEGAPTARDDRWSEAIAVGSLGFVETVKNDLGDKARHHDVMEVDGTFTLREPPEAYAGKFTGEIEALRTQSTILWDESVDDARTWLGPIR